MTYSDSENKPTLNRREFLKFSAAAAGAATLGDLLDSDKGSTKEEERISDIPKITLSNRSEIIDDFNSFIHETGRKVDPDKARISVFSITRGSGRQDFIVDPARENPDGTIKKELILMRVQNGWLRLEARPDAGDNLKYAIWGPHDRPTEFTMIYPSSTQENWNRLTEGEKNAHKLRFVPSGDKLGDFGMPKDSSGNYICNAAIYIELNKIPLEVRTALGTPFDTEFIQTPRGLQA